ncbi:hypothetical protein M8J75_012095 [Diaphorina citri]|nr:hypothetical protein M8J75_012095 [Diaphorina citri]
MPTPSSVLNSSYYTHKLHGNQPSLPKPAVKSRIRSRSTSPANSSSSSSYSNYNYRKPPKIEISSIGGGSDRVKRFSKIDGSSGEEDLALDSKINAYLSRSSNVTTKYRAPDVKTDLTSTRRDGGTSRLSVGTPRVSHLDVSSWESTGKGISVHHVTTPAHTTVPKSTLSDPPPRSREVSPPNTTASTPLSRKIAEFLHRTDHISEEWKKLGAKKNNKTKPEGRADKVPAKSQSHSQDETKSSRCNSGLSNRDESESTRPESQQSHRDTRSVSRLSTVGNESQTRPLSQQSERDTRSVSRLSTVGNESQTRPLSRQSERDTRSVSRLSTVGNESQTRPLSRQSERDTRSVSRLSTVGNESQTRPLSRQSERDTRSVSRLSTVGNKESTPPSRNGETDKEPRPGSRQDNYKTRLGEITEDYADEHSTATLATERLTHESSERSRLEKELAEAQSTNKKLQETSEKLELEVQCLRSTDALSLDLSDEGSDATGGEGDLYRKKWERAMRELEFTKHRLTQQHQDDLEQLVGLRKQLEKKLSDAYEQIEEQRNVAAEWKRKVARVNSEMSDQRLLLEEQSSRNTLLEKKQRKFDAEYQMLQDELRQERNQKEKALRDKELALGDKYTMEQTLSSLKLELELKDQKLSSLAQELEELTFSGNTEEEVQMLEQAKLKVEMNLEQVRKAHRKELASKDEELEALRCSTMKKVKALQSQLESEHESRTALLRERHELERRLANLEDMGVATRSAEVETNQRLKKDLKRTKALLKDTQTMLVQSRQDNPNKLLVRQLRNQLEDAEVSRNVATKARQTMESDLADVTVQLEETSRAKSELETRLSAVLRERSQLQSQLDENEEEMTEVLKKYQASVQQLSSEQASLQEATTRISELEAETSSYKDQLAELNSKLESIETHGDPSSTLALKRLQLKCKELESKLEFEHTTRSRLEVQINRLKENTDKLQSECNVLRAKESASSNDVRKLQRTIRELKENIQSLEAKGINDSLKRKELEKEIQCREAERIADLQHAIRGDIDDSDSDEDSDNSTDIDLGDNSSDNEEEYHGNIMDDAVYPKDTVRSESAVGR